MADSPKLTSGRKQPSFYFISGRTLIVLLVIVAGLLLVRVAAPGYIRHAINQRLNKIPAYSGQVGDVDLQLWRGAYRIHDITIMKKTGQIKEPFFAAKQIDFSLAWRELFHGKFVSDIIVSEGRLNFVRGATEASSQLTADRRWQDVINDLFPIDITHLVIEHGLLRYADYTRTPTVDLSITELNADATGLRNRPSSKAGEFPAKINLTGQTPGHGKLGIFSKLEPLAQPAHLEVNVELKDVSLPVLNNFLRAYANVDVSKGRFELFGQLAVGGGHYEGYVKPFLDQIDFKDYPNQDATIGKRLWETIVAGVVDLVKNKQRNQFATRIPFSGDAGKMDVGTWTAIANTLHHGFIKALHEGFEGTTHPDSSETKVPTEANNEAAAKADKTNAEKKTGK